MDIMEKEVFVGAKREKRGQRFFVKKRHVCSSKVSSQNDFSLFLSLFSLSLITFSLSLLLYSSQQRARCAVEADKTSTSASIHALLASSHRRRNNNGRRRRRNFDRDEDDEDDDRVSRARRRGKTTRNFLSLFRIGKRSFSFSRSRSLLNADAPLPSLSLSIYIYIRR